MQSTDVPRIVVDEFEGPFDVLLEFVQRRKIDISSLSLAKITEDFLQYVAKTSLPPSTRADFLIVAATLVLLKLKAAVPSLTPDEEEEVAELTERIQIYQHYRRASGALIRQWQREPLQPGANRLYAGVQPELVIAPSRLQQSLERVLNQARIKAQPLKHLRTKRISIRAQLDVLKKRLARVDQSSFQELFPQADRSTIATALLALLELTRQQYVTLEQKSEFGTITIATTRKNV